VGRAHTQTINIAASPAQVFDFVADPETLPLWAVGFCRRIRRDGPRWIVTTSHGDMALRLDADRIRGTIDFYWSPASGIELGAFSRVVPNGDGAEYIFTQFQSAGMSDEAFDGQVTALGEELRVLGSILRARAVCPA
jgi:polyketide cyclase/dehydrase/lipid transport protein